MPCFQETFQQKASEVANVINSAKNQASTLATSLDPKQQTFEPPEMSDFADLGAITSEDLICMYSLEKQMSTLFCIWGGKCLCISNLALHKFKTGV